jgi:hypothetical protein
MVVSHNHHDHHFAKQEAPKEVESLLESKSYSIAKLLESIQDVTTTIGDLQQLGAVVLANITHYLVLPLSPFLSLSLSPRSFCSSPLFSLSRSR